MKTILSTQYFHAQVLYKKLSKKMYSKLQNGGVNEIGKIRQYKNTLERLKRKLLRLETQLKLSGSVAALGLTLHAQAQAPVFQYNFGIGSAESGRSALVFADLDNDGDKDALLGNVSGNLEYFANTGTSASPAFGPASVNAFGLSNTGILSLPTLVDIDGDGDLDAFVGINDGNIKFFQNTGTAVLPAFAAVSSNPFGLMDVGGRSAPSFADLDHDGDLDAFIGEYTGVIKYFQNTGSSNSPAFAAPSNNPFGLSSTTLKNSPSFADLDMDGDMDAMLGGIDGNVRYFTNDGTSASPSFSSASVNPFGFFDVGFDSTPSFVDIDADGDLDAYVGTYYGSLIYFVNQSTNGGFPVFKAINFNPFGLSDVGSLSSPTFVDIDNDGDLDAFSGTLTDASIKFFNNTGTSSTPAFAAVASNPFGLTNVAVKTHPAFADLDHDGDLDAFFGESQSIKYFNNTGNASAPAFATPITNPFGISGVGLNSAPSFMDLDADGDLDILVGEYYGNFQYFKNTGSNSAPAFASPILNPFSLSDVGFHSTPAFFDLDNDGDLDLLSGERTGNIKYFMNTGLSNAPLFAAVQINTLGFVDVGNSSSPAIFDLGSDGFTDVVVGEKYGNFLMFRNTIKLPQTITFTQSNVSMCNGNIMLNASSTSGEGVAFEVVSGNATVSGSTLSITGTGSITVKATQGGNINYESAGDVSRTFVVTAPVPTGLSATAGTDANNFAKINFDWADAATTVKYQIAWRVQNTGAWTNAYPTSSQYTASGLLGGTTYEWNVRTLCNASGTVTGSWAGVQTITTGTGSVCAVPTSPSSSFSNAGGPITGTFSWANATGATSYQFVYRKTGTTAWVNSFPTTNTATVTNLNPSSTYEWNVLTRCTGGVQSGWMGTQTTGATPTGFVCAAPTGLASTPASTSASLSWNQASGNAGYLVAYWVTGTTSYQFKSPLIDVNSANLTSLSSGTAYTWKTLTKCSGVNSSYSPVSTFTTSALKATTSLGAMSSLVSIYPNPTTGKVTLSGVSHDAQVVVYTVQGQMVITTQGNSVDLTLQPKGVYVVKAIVGGTVHIGKIVVE